MVLVRSLVLLVSLSWAVTGWADHAESEPSDGTVNSFIQVDPPKPVTPVMMMQGQDELIDLSAFHGKLVLLNFWATWCPPCIRELPALDRLQQRLGSDRFEVVAVALDRRGYEGAKEFYDKLEIKHLGLYTGSVQAFGEQFPVDVFPASFVLDPQGRVLSFLRSYADWDDEAADHMIKDLLAKYGG